MLQAEANVHERPSEVTQKSQHRDFDMGNHQVDEVKNL